MFVHHLITWGFNAFKDETNCEYNNILESSFEAVFSSHIVCWKEEHCSFDGDIGNTFFVELFYFLDFKTRFNWEICNTFLLIFFFLGFKANFS
jgi:hypothetical protein